MPKTPEKKRLRAVLRGAAAVVGGLGVVVGAGLVGPGGEVVAEGGAPPALFAGVIPDYPGAMPVVPVADGMEVNGLQMRVGFFRTADPPDVVREFYAEAFAREGLHVQATPAQEGGAGVSAFDTRGGHQRSVAIFRQGGETLVFPAVTPLGQKPAGTERALPPGPGGARLVSDVAATDLGHASRTVTMVTDLDAATATADLIRRLRTAGYEVDAPKENRAGRVIDAQRDETRVTYTVSGADGRPTGVVAVVQQGRAAP